MGWRERLITLLRAAEIDVWPVGSMPYVRPEAKANVIVRPAGRDGDNALVCELIVLGNPVTHQPDPDEGLEEDCAFVWETVRVHAVDVYVLAAEPYQIIDPSVVHPAVNKRTSIPVWTSMTLTATDPCRPGLRRQTQT